MNPVLPLNEYLCDCEPHLFDQRLYLYGSHDRYHGTHYCQQDYVCYSCDYTDLTNWKYEGIIYHRNQDPLNPDGMAMLYAPDVVRGNDGKYYLYYCLNGIDAVGVAVSDSAAGPFQFYGHVRYPQGIDKNQLDDYPNSFDPAVINDHGRILLTLGFSIDAKIPGMKLTKQNTKGAYIVELETDMLTMKQAPTYIIPGYYSCIGTDFENHPFLEASSLKEFNNRYYFIYSSLQQHELCYATSEDAFGPYHYEGVLLSNADKNSKEDIYRNNWANNHGSIFQVNDNYYLSYHRHSCGTQFSRQVCMEKIQLIDGKFQTAHITSNGIGQPLKKGIYPAGYACEVYDQPQGVFLDFDKVINKARIDDQQIVNATFTTIVYRYFESIQKVKLNCQPFTDNYHYRINKKDNLYEIIIVMESPVAITIDSIEVN